MNTATSVVSAFSEEQTASLTGVSRGQLAYWDRTGFYRPSYAEQNRRISFSRIYSFKDIIALRVLNVLRNQYGVSLQRLRSVGAQLGRLDSDPERWMSVDLYVLNKRVIWHEPGTELPQEIVSGQYVVPTLNLIRVREDTKRDFQARPRQETGRIVRSRHVAHNRPFIVGTRITVQAIKNFAKEGYSAEEIRREYPSLTLEDIEAAIGYQTDSAA